MRYPEHPYELVSMGDKVQIRLDQNDVPEPAQIAVNADGNLIVIELDKNAIRSLIWDLCRSAGVSGMSYHERSEFRRMELADIAQGKRIAELLTLLESKNGH